MRKLSAPPSLGGMKRLHPPGKCIRPHARERNGVQIPTITAISSEYLWILRYIEYGLYCGHLLLYRLTVPQYHGRGTPPAAFAWPCMSSPTLQLTKITGHGPCTGQRSVCMKAKSMKLCRHPGMKGLAAQPYSTPLAPTASHLLVSRALACWMM